MHRAEIHLFNDGAYIVPSLWCVFSNNRRYIIYGKKYGIEKRKNEYSRLSLNGHLYKTDTSVQRTLKVGPYVSLLLLFDSQKDGHLSKTDT